MKKKTPEEIQLMQTRRGFFLSSVAALALTRRSCALSSLVSQQDVFTSASLGAYGQDLLTPKHFEQLEGTLFMAFIDDDNVVYMRLIEVRPFASEPGAPTPQKRSTQHGRLGLPEAQTQCFALIFNSDGDLPNRRLT
jgi:hypothetical protein